MDSNTEALGLKRAEPSSTVSLDSTYHENGEPVSEKPRLRTRHSWAPFVAVVALILVAVGLILALDRGQVHEREILSSHALKSVPSLTAPQKKLNEWLKQVNNASALYVEGGSSNMSLNGVLFPRNGTDSSLPFDAVVTIDSGVVLPRRQNVVLANGRGFKWVTTSFGYGDSITTTACLTVNRTVPFNEFGSIVSTANWLSTDPEDKSDVSVVFGGVNYTVSKENISDYYSDSNSCWLVENKNEDLGLRVCIPELIEPLPKEDFAELFNATTGCPQLTANMTRTKAHMDLLVPLPLRKWYASYKA
ncbi:hypothetical protein PHMEG_00023294 [Phytophthora megakarya]|uniref:Uncharacterized protein n=1 Tax=Phytophthora megakarya TaxID=4795 RepID=A0A225VHF1_9STRA|nr:hypothetical protein PHMEG_00023294 [Phytophthora megakarya]